METEGRDAAQSECCDDVIPTAAEVEAEEESKKPIDRGLSVSKIHLQKGGQRTFKKMVGKYIIVTRVTKTNRTVEIEDGPNVAGAVEAEPARKSQLEQAMAVNRTVVMNLLKKFYGHEVQELKSLIGVYRRLKGDIKQLRTEYRKDMKKAQDLENMFDADLELNENPLGAEETSGRRLNLKILDAQEDLTEKSMSPTKRDLDVEAQSNVMNEKSACQMKSMDDDVDKESHDELPIIQTRRILKTESQQSFTEVEDDPRGGFMTPSSYITDSEDEGDNQGHVVNVEQQSEDRINAKKKDPKKAAKEQKMKGKTGTLSRKASKIQEERLSEARNIYEPQMRNTSHAPALN